MDCAMPTYKVTLDYPKSSGMGAFIEYIEAVTKAEAILIAKGLAYEEGWPNQDQVKGESAVIVEIGKGE